MSGRFAGCVVCFAFLILLSGCAPGTDVERPDTIPVTGTVTYNDKAVEGATVAFSPTGEGGDGAIGVTDASGNFTLQTQWGAAGAVAGSYAVTITKSEGHTTSEEDLAEAQIGDAPPAEVKDALPKKYGSADTSELNAEVKAGEENNFPFNLTD